eukprot:4790125-Pyramimonas_sp.AAC.2
MPRRAPLRVAVHELKDGHIFKSLEKVLDPDAKLSEIHAARQDALKRLGSKHEAHPFMHMLLIKVSMSMFNKEHVAAAFKLLRERIQHADGDKESTKQFVSGGFALLNSLGTYFPLLFADALDDLQGLLEVRARRLARRSMRAASGTLEHRAAPSNARRISEKTETRETLGRSTRAPTRFLVHPCCARRPGEWVRERRRQPRTVVVERVEETRCSRGRAIHAPPRLSTTAAVVLHRRADVSSVPRIVSYTHGFAAAETTGPAPGPAGRAGAERRGDGPLPHRARAGVRRRVQNQARRQAGPPPGRAGRLRLARPGQARRAGALRARRRGGAGPEGGGQVRGRGAGERLRQAGVDLGEQEFGPGELAGAGGADRVRADGRGDRAAAAAPVRGARGGGARLRAQVASELRES